MFILKCFALIVVISVYVHCNELNNELDNDTTTTGIIASDAYLMSKEVQLSTEKEVNIVVAKVYYEALCPYCIRFFINDLQPVVESMHEYLDLRLLPYGNANTVEQDGKFVIKCQHGEKECYGNKLHACGIDILNNVTKSALYACCMMLETSTDKGATECGKSMEIDADPIMDCAKSDRGQELLKHYGDLSHQIKYPGVPYILVNDKESSSEDFKQDICSALTNPPPACSSTDEIKNKKVADMIRLLDSFMND